MSKDTLWEVVMRVVDAQPTIDEYNQELVALNKQLESLQGKKSGRLALMRRMTALYKQIQDLGGKPSVPEFKFIITLTLRK